MEEHKRLLRGGWEGVLARVSVPSRPLTPGAILTEDCWQTGEPCTNLSRPQARPELHRRLALRPGRAQGFTQSRGSAPAGDHWRRW